MMSNIQTHNEWCIVINMEIAVTALIVLMILFHVYAFILEAFLWQTPRAFKAFGTNKITAASSQTLATNQGVYNLFLAAGLVWALISTDTTAFQAKVFFLSCIIIAAATAGATVSKRIMVIQGMPALIALLLVVLSR